MNRREWIVATAALAATLPLGHPARAQSAPATAPTLAPTGAPGTIPAGMRLPILPPLESFPIWPAGRIPGGAGVSVKDEWILRSPKDGDPNDTATPHIAEPILMVRRAAKPNGAALLMVPGGGYIRVAVSRAGGPYDQHFADEGTTVFVMTYRMPADGWTSGALAPLQDAQRALRLIRHRAKAFAIDPARVGVIGFSAGGHLAGWLAESFAKETYAPLDDVDKQSAKPIVAGLFYPVMTMLPPYAHAGSVGGLFPKGASEAEKKVASLEFNLPPDMPPTFLAHAGDDPVVPTENSLILYQALRAQKTPSELHLFEIGGHGLRVGDTDLPFMPPFEAFARRHGLWG